MKLVVTCFYIANFVVINKTTLEQWILQQMGLDVTDETGGYLICVVMHSFHFLCRTSARYQCLALRFAIPTTCFFLTLNDHGPENLSCQRRRCTSSRKIWAYLCFFFLSACLIFTKHHRALNRMSISGDSGGAFRWISPQGLMGSMG